MINPANACEGNWEWLASVPMEWPDHAKYDPYRGAVRIVTAEDAMRWAPQCLEYFSTFSEGIYDDPSYLQVILPAQDVHISPHEPDDLVIGHAGSDGIYFCFRVGVAGVWAYYEMEGCHRLLAETLAEFVPGWQNSTIHV